MIVVQKSCPNCPFESDIQKIERLKVVKNVKEGTLCCSLSTPKCSHSKEIDDLRKEVADLKDIIDQYKFSSESFERRVVDLQQDLRKKDEELKLIKERLRINLKHYGSETREARLDEPVTTRKLFVGGLPQNATDRDLFNHFSIYGVLVDAMVMKDPNTHKSRGFGFVIFSEAFMADTAQANKPHIILNKEVETKRAIPKSHIIESTPPKPIFQVKRVFVGGLRSTTTNDTLRRYFGDFGRVESVNVIEDSRSGKSRGFAYVTFADPCVADKVALQKVHTIDSRRCEVKPAFSKIFKPNEEPYSNRPPSEGVPRDYPPTPDMYGGYYGAQHYEAYAYQNYQKAKAPISYHQSLDGNNHSFITPHPILNTENPASMNPPTERTPNVNNTFSINNNNNISLETFLMFAHHRIQN